MDNFQSNSEIENYKKSIRVLCDSKSKLIFSNRDATHAAEVLLLMFSSASERVVVYHDFLDGKITENSENLLEEIENFISSEKQFILILKRPNKNIGHIKFVKLLKRALEKPTNNLRIFRSCQEFDKKILKIFHADQIEFTLADKDKLRVQYDSNNSKAKCSFNNVYFGDMLSDLIEKSFGSSLIDITEEFKLNI